MNTLKQLVLALIVCVGISTSVVVSTTGCGAVGPATVATVVSTVADAILAVDEAESILDSVERAAEVFFVARPDESLQQKFANVLQKTRQGLNVARRALVGVKSLTQQELDAAFADFRAAWGELQALLKSTGVLSGGRLAASPGVAAEPLPEPMALTLKVRQ